MTESQLVQFVEMFSHMSFLDSILGSFIGIGMWKLLDLIFIWGANRD